METFEPYDYIQAQANTNYWLIKRNDDLKIIAGPYEFIRTLGTIIGKWNHTTKTIEHYTI